MTSDEIKKEVENRIYNACMGETSSQKIKKIVKFTLAQAFIDGLLVIPYEAGGPIMLSNDIHTE